jgi:Uri superfamily endonuclease
MKGVYVLVVSVVESVYLKVGALGNMFFEEGTYVYVGSGQVGLEKRVARHMRRVKKLFWHIDYLLNSDVAKVVRVFWKEGEKSEECRLAEILGEHGVPVVGFGCSDCRCRSHLFRIREYGFIGELMRELRSQPVGSVR